VIVDNGSTLQLGGVNSAPETLQIKGASAVLMSSSGTLAFNTNIRACRTRSLT